MKIRKTRSKAVVLVVLVCIIINSIIGTSFSAENVTYDVEMNIISADALSSEDSIEVGMFNSSNKIVSFKSLSNSNLTKRGEPVLSYKVREKIDFLCFSLDSTNNGAKDWKATIEFAETSSKESVKKVYTATVNLSGERNKVNYYLKDMDVREEEVKKDTDSSQNTIVGSAFGEVDMSVYLIIGVVVVLLVGVAVVVMKKRGKKLNNSEECNKNNDNE